MPSLLPWASGLLIAAFALFIAYVVLLLYGNSLLAKEERTFFFFALGAILFCFFSVVPGALLLPSRLSLPILVLVGVVGFLGFFALLNPKLKDWYRLDRTEENGATYYVKPKVNYLALYEWIFLVLINLVAFLLFINIIVTGTVVY